MDNKDAKEEIDEKAEFIKKIISTIIEETDKLSQISVESRIHESLKFINQNNNRNIFVVVEKNENIIKENETVIYKSFERNKINSYLIMMISNQI
ncbi:MAG: hypothetical protein K2X69_06295 [Silvanigrellaceae bacterium]|nr:hypothetical protein [Silvanigrellaceae bacterium]